MTNEKTFMVSGFFSYYDVRMAFVTSKVLHIFWLAIESERFVLYSECTEMF